MDRFDQTVKQVHLDNLRGVNRSLGRPLDCKSGVIRLCGSIPSRPIGDLRRIKSSREQLMSVEKTAKGTKFTGDSGYVVELSGGTDGASIVVFARDPAGRAVGVAVPPDEWLLMMQYLKES